MDSIEKEKKSCGINMTPPGQKRTSLLGMPPEIRNEIWNYALIGPRHVPIHYKDPLFRPSEGLCGPKAAPKEPPLLSTCKQIRDEGLAKFYGESIFEPKDDPFLDAFHVALVFIKTLSDQKLSLLRAVHGGLCTAGVGITKPQQWLAAMHGLGKELIRLGRGFLRRDAVLVPLPIDGDVVWCTVDDLKNFEVVQNGWVWDRKGWKARFVLKRKEGR